ncbi:MAG: hypothetical protein ACE5FW_00785 [Candidatus Aenigmatarchaeota archaeon]
MIDWRILGASFVALLAVSSVFVGASGAFGIGDFFSNLMAQIGSWLQGSPFGGFFAAPEARSSQIDILLFPENFTLKPDTPINVNLDGVYLTDFKGEVTTDFLNKTISFSEEGSPLQIAMPMKETVIEDFKLTSFSATGVRFQISPNITAENGTLDMGGFLGTCTITEEHIHFQGNISRVRAKIGDLLWEIK